MLAEPPLKLRLALLLSAVASLLETFDNSSSFYFRFKTREFHHRELLKQPYTAFFFDDRREHQYGQVLKSMVCYICLEL